MIVNILQSFYKFANEEIKAQTVNSSMTQTSSYRHLFNRIINLIVRPKNEWAAVESENGSMNDILTVFTLPLIGFIAIAAFVSNIIYSQEFIFDVALKQAAIAFIAPFASLFAVFYLMQWIHRKLTPDSLPANWFSITAYSAGLIYLIEIIIWLLPELYVFKISIAYTGIMVWFGIQSVTTNQTKQIIYCATITLLLIFLPIIITRLFYGMVRFQ
jgi:hypothetical protein